MVVMLAELAAVVARADARHALAAPLSMIDFKAAFMASARPSTTGRR
jgi:hypothetical protein